MGSKKEEFFPVIDVLNRPEAEFNEVERGLNLRRGSNMVGSSKIAIIVSRFKPALN